MVNVEQVGKEYAGPRGTVRALDGVSFEMKAGEFLAVQGPSGCGKTTLLLTIGGLLFPSAGRITINCQDPYALSANERARWRARTIGFVFQQFHLVPYLNTLDNILLPSLACPTPDAQDRARELIARFGLNDRVHHVPAEISTGERQRTALVRALLNRPDVILADEPTGNLDTANSTEVLECLVEFARDGGAVLLVTHNPQAAAYAHRTVHMRAGTVCDGPENAE